MSLTIEDIQLAAANIKGAVVRTPCHHSRTLSEITGADLTLKFENLQFTASFKDRGALNKLLSLGSAERQRGVIAMSAGNHAQGVAYHAQRLQIPATIVMPLGTPYVKMRQTEHFGAKVVLEGEGLAEAAAAARRMAEDQDLTFVHPYDDSLIIAGQGTVALEMLETAPDLEVLVVPVGGGGLISGMATAAKALKPDIEVVAVEAALYPALYYNLKGEEGVCGGASIADGIAVKQVGTLPLEICRDLVDGTVLVSETYLERAVNLLLTIEKTVAEGAGAAALAAVMAEPERFKGRRTGLVITGGNIDPRLLATVIMRELMRDGRIARLVVDVADSPGHLAKVANVVAEFGCSIVEVGHQRLTLDVTAKHTNLDMMIETRDADQVTQIVERLRSAGFTVRQP